MKLDHPILTNLGGLLGSTWIRFWMDSLDFKIAFYDPSVDPASPDCCGQKIYIFWHEYILFPISLRGHCNMAMLLSQHRDADVLSRVAYHLGFEFVRGSTRRGGIAAIRELLRKSQRMHLAITPDGPRGPRRHMAPGAIYLASKLGLPLVVMGFGFDRPWRVPSWDRFAIPRPLSRGRAVVAPEVRLPADLDREGLEHYRQEVERLLTRMTNEAEAWAASSTRKICQLPLRRRPAPPVSRRHDSAHRLEGGHTCPLVPVEPSQAIPPSSTPTP